MELFSGKLISDPDLLLESEEYSESSVHKLSRSQSGKMVYGASYGCKLAFRGPTQNFAPEKCR